MLGVFQTKKKLLQTWRTNNFREGKSPRHPPNSYNTAETQSTRDTSVHLQICDRFTSIRECVCRRSSRVEIKARHLVVLKEAPLNPPGHDDMICFQEVTAHSNPKGHYSSASPLRNKADYTCGIITETTWGTRNDPRRRHSENQRRVIRVGGEHKSPAVEYDQC